MVGFFFIKYITFFYLKKKKNKQNNWQKHLNVLNSTLELNCNKIEQD